MSVKRVWFLNEPDAQIGINDRYQIAVGYPLVDVGISPTEQMDKYLRRYLNDPKELTVAGPAINKEDTLETAMTRYLRRYLNDPKS